MKIKWKIIISGLAIVGATIGILYSWPYIFVMGGAF
jgi:hypothetical protein